MTKSTQTHTTSWNPDISIWLSVDPLSDKYPSLSPYNYCANNPIKYVDPDGRDFESVVDEKNKTITIKVVYYTNSNNAEKLQKGLDVWNNQSGKYRLDVGEGEDKKSYTVNFELKKIINDNLTDEKNNDYSFNRDGKSNIFDISSDLEKKTKGEITEGFQIVVKPNASIRTIVHEIGHSLGIGECSRGAMKSGGSSMSIKREHISTILTRAGIQNYSTFMTGATEILDKAKTNSQEMYGKLVKNKKR